MPTVRIVTGLLLVAGRRTGTVWFVAPDTCVTAAHCVADVERRAVTEEPKRIRCLGKERAATVLGAPNFDLDVALLRVSPSVPKEACLRVRASTSEDFGRRWEGYGYPNTKPDGLHLTGHIDAVDGAVDGVPALQLSHGHGGFDEDDLKGCSGGPVVCGDAVVGVIRATPARLGRTVMFASRSAEIAKAFPGAIRLFETLRNMPNLAPSPVRELGPDRIDTAERSVFISYAREDRPKAAVLAGLLGREGWTVWWDRHIAPGRYFDQEIERALDQAGCVVVLWSANSVSSQWVRAEAQVGLDRNVLVPVLLEEVQPPLIFRSIQSVNLLGWDAPTAHPEIGEMVSFIRQLLGNVGSAGQ